MSKLETPRGDRYRYTYDALGRRIGKTCETASSDSDHHPAGQHTAYLWDGATLVEEVPTYADGTPAWQQATTWHYQPDSFVPLAKQTHEDDQLYYIVTDHLGTPKELVEEDGTPVWRQQYSVWGALLNRADAANDSVNPKVDCALRFQGQYQDAESGLYYNYQRYYDPNTAQYLTPDPIGLLGGTRPMGYVHNPNGWVDPLRLAGNLETTQNTVNTILQSYLPQIQAIDPNATIGYRGSLASGLSKVHLNPTTINLKSFDVDAFIKSDFLASNSVYSNRTRDANKLGGMSSIEASINSELRQALPGNDFKGEDFGFRVFKTHELDELARDGDVQVRLPCK